MKNLFSNRISIKFLISLIVGTLIFVLLSLKTFDKNPIYERLNQLKECVINEINIVNHLKEISKDLDDFIETTKLDLLKETKLAEIVNKLKSLSDIGLSVSDDERSNMKFKMNDDVTLKVNVKLVSLNSDIIPLDLELYNRIKCVKTQEVYVSTTVCLHNPENDHYISKTLLNNGIWEINLLSTF